MSDDLTLPSLSATALLRAYLANIRDPEKAASLFADDGVIELPWVNARVQGRAAVAGLVSNLLRMIPDFAFKSVQFWIETPDKVYAEYTVEAVVAATGKLYRQTYCGVLIAEDGKIKLLREALNTSEANRAFSKD